jgi:hypothetical protein
MLKISITYLYNITVSCIILEMSIDRTPRLELPSPVDLPVTSFSPLPIEVDSELLSGVQVFSGSFTPGSGDRPNEALIVYTAFFDGPHGNIQKIRNQLIANETGLDVVSIGTPGMALRELGLSKGQVDSYGLTESQHEALVSGIFKRLGKDTWRATRELAVSNGLSLSDRRLHFLNYSMANSVMAGVLASGPDEIANGTGGLGRVIYAESPSLRPQRESRLRSNFTSKHESKANAQYEAKNPEWVPGSTNLAGLLNLAGNILHRPRDHRVLMSAMAKGLMMKELLDGYRAIEIAGKDIDAVFADGTHSDVCNSGENINAATKLKLRANAPHAQHEEWPLERHGFCNDLGAYTLRVAELLK